MRCLALAALLSALPGACRRAGPDVEGPVGPPPVALPGAPVEAPIAPWTMHFVDSDNGEVRTMSSVDVPESVAWWEGEGRRVPVVRVEARRMGTGMEVRRYAEDGALLDVLVTAP